MSKIILDFLKAYPTFGMMNFVGKKIHAFECKKTEECPLIKIFLLNRELDLYGEPVKSRFMRNLEQIQNITQNLINNDHYYGLPIYAMLGAADNIPNFYTEVMLSHMSEFAYNVYIKALGKEAK